MRYSCRTCHLQTAIEALFFLSLLLPSLPVMGASGTVVFYYDKSQQPVVTLDRISPVSEGMKAILAMYAFQNGAGCTGGTDEAPRCSFSEALDIGGQCSDQHLALVLKWFSTGMPKMSGYADSAYRSIKSTEDLKPHCYRTPYTASFQTVWDLIRVTTSGKEVRIYAHGLWRAASKSGSFSYITEYDVGGDSIEVISHQGGFNKVMR